VKIWKTTINILTNYDPGSMNLKTLAKAVDFGDGAVLWDRKAKEVDQRDYNPEVLNQLKGTDASKQE